MGRTGLSVHEPHDRMLGLTRDVLLGIVRPMVDRLAAAREIPITAVARVNDLSGISLFRH